MSWIYLHENRERVRQALLRGHVDKVATLRATAFDELAAAMHTFGYWEPLESIEIKMDKDEDDVPDELVVRELAVLPLVRIRNPHQAPVYFFRTTACSDYWGSRWPRSGTGSTTRGDKVR